MDNVKDINDSINTTYYLNKYSDLKNAYGNNRNAAKKHFLNYGVYEKRYFNLPYQQTLEGIAKNKSNSGNMYPYTNKYVKFPNMTTNVVSTTLIENKRNINDDTCIKLCNQKNNCGGITYDRSNSSCKIWDLNVYPDADMTSTNKQDFYMRIRELRKYCDDECMKTRDLEKLEKKFDEMYNNSKIMPEKVEEVTKNLMIKSEGENFYKEFKQQHYEEVSSNVINKVKKAYTKIYNFRMDLLNSYIKKVEYHNLLKSDKSNKEILNYKKLIEKKNNEKNLEARKSYYEEKESDNLDNYIDYFLFFYYSLFLVYLYLFFRDGKYQNWKQILLPILFLIAPYLVYFYVIYYMRTFYEYLTKKIPKNVYLTKQK